MTTPIDGLDQFAAAVMARVNADGGAAVVSEIATGAVNFQGAPPRVVWEPTRDRFVGAQKKPRGSRGPRGVSVGTRMAGGVAHIWGDGTADGSITPTTGTERLLKRVARAMMLVGGGPPFFELTGGTWNAKPGVTDCGRVYELPFAVAVDLDLAVPTVTTITIVALDPSRSTAGDGLVDAGEPAPAP